MNDWPGEIICFDGEPCDNPDADCNKCKWMAERKPKGEEKDNE